MKKTFLIAAIAALSACNSGTEKKDESTSSTNADSTRKEEVVYAYPVQYTNMEMGDAKHGQTVLNIWKAWDSGDLSGMKNSFADSVEFHFWDGTSMKGSRDSALSSIQLFRSSFSSVTSSVLAVMSIKTTNKNSNQIEDLVLVWGKEVSTSKKGKTDSIWLHEVWRVNKDGKADFANQFAEFFPKTPTPKSK